MQLHRNAKLGLRGRYELVLAIQSGMTLKAAAAAFSVSPATAHRWWHRWLQASEEERSALTCLHDRSSRPRRSPCMLPASEQARICAARRRSGWGPRLIAGETGHPHATVWRTLRRAGLSRGYLAARARRRAATSGPAPATCCTSTASVLAASPAPGTRSRGVRDRTGAERRMRVGHEFVHSIVDDHSRLAYSEVHRDERAATVVAFVERALAFFDGHGIEAKRLLSDNAWAYTHSRALRELLERRGIRHLLIAKRRPQTNGKVERYQQTLKREWALGHVYRSSEHRTAALSHWLEHYNRRRPHSSLGGLPPISRVHNVPRQDT